ncbi:rmd12p [Saccharomyces arboricola H-6]|uniref:Rmd12p n=1 Tax=Saccharomyces arboricola (strain H-6 / AS 2.3317 / CBS 10644) TaxID=1160507 RepID=J8Q749_SACAR|nr:rmd12p [Saccharomyces arboricola H-6]
MKSTSWIFKDFLSKHRVKSFDSLLSRRIPTSNARKHLQIGEHFLFFPPPFDNLGKDGYFNYQSPATLLENPELRYRRRIWGQGELMQYSPLNLDQEYTCQESIKYIKKLRDEHIVCIERALLQDCPENGPGKNGVCLLERRVLMYTNSLANKISAKSPTEKEDYTSIKTLTITDMDIIAYGQQSLNPHRIHWDKEYSRQVEGYEDIIMQGPFSVQLLVKCIQPLFGKPITQLRYRNLNYIYPGTTLNICQSLNPSSNTVAFQVRDLQKTNSIYLTAEVSC